MASSQRSSRAAKVTPGKRELARLGGDQNIGAQVEVPDAMDARGGGTPCRDAVPDAWLDPLVCEKRRGGQLPTCLELVGLGRGDTRHAVDAVHHAQEPACGAGLREGVSRYPEALCLRSREDPLGGRGLAGGLHVVASIHGTVVSYLDTFVAHVYLTSFLTPAATKEARWDAQGYRVAWAGVSPHGEKSTMRSA